MLLELCGSPVSLPGDLTVLCQAPRPYVPHQVISIHQKLGMASSPKSSDRKFRGARSLASRQALLLCAALIAVLIYSQTRSRSPEVGH